MEPFSILVALFVIGLVVIAAVLAALGYSRIGNLQQRVTRLERELVSARKPEEAARAAPTSVPTGPASASVAHSAPTSAPTPAPMAAPIAAAMSAAPPPTPPTTPSTTERAPAPAPSPVFAPTPPRAERPPIEWERWLGVRGAAVLGGIFLAVAGILFFKYSIERGLITPQMRVIGGAIFGSACLVGGEWMRRRRYELTANAISGAGAVILYAAFWAANQFSIVPLVVAFAAMCAVTALACWLSWRNGSQLIAWLGLTGGFATPILLSSGQDHPLGLLAYLLLLDIGFLMTANRRGWSLLGLLGLAGTFTIWGLWIAERMGPATFFVALIGLGLFALLFVLLVPKKLGSERALWIVSQAGALLMPFVFALYFSQRIDVGYHIYPLVILSVLLGCAASWMARKQNSPWLPAGAAAGASATLLSWALARQIDDARAWELCVCVAVLVGAYLAFCEWRRPSERELARGHDVALLVAAFGSLIAVVVSASIWEGQNTLPFLVAFAVLTGVLSRLSARAGWIWLAYLGCIAGGFGFMLIETRELLGIQREPWLILVGIAAPLAIFHASALLRRDPGARKHAFAAALWGALQLFLIFAVDNRRLEPDPIPIEVSFAYAALVSVALACAATGARSGWLFAVASAAALAATSSLIDTPVEHPLFETARIARLQFEYLVGGFLLFLFWPLLRVRVWENARNVWILASISGLAWFLAITDWARANSEADRIGLLAAGATLLALVAAWYALRGRGSELAIEGARDRSARASGGIDDLALAGVFASIILPEQFVREAVPFASAFSALAVAWIWRATAARGYRLLAAAGAVLAVSVLVCGYGFTSFEHDKTMLWNWHAFDLLLPGVAVLIAAWALSCPEASLLSSVERSVPILPSGWTASLTGLSGLTLVFLWMNVELQNGFATGPRFALSFEGDSGHATWTSIVWAIYALVMLGVGMWKKIGGLRWVSLVLLLVTIGKLFLLDLQDLEGLWRVASFLGLAVSLLLVSLLYQRFVFRRSTPSAPQPA